MADAVYGGVIGGTGTSAATDLELTTAWNVNAAYEHFWNPRWRTSLYGGYAAVSYGERRATASAAALAPAVRHQRLRSDWQTWWVGSRTQWNVTKDFYMGLDVMYSKLESATAFVTPAGSFSVSPNVLPASETDPDNWSFRFRVHRDFYP